MLLKASMICFPPGYIRWLVVLLAFEDLMISHNVWYQGKNRQNQHFNQFGIKARIDKINISINI